MSCKLALSHRVVLGAHSRCAFGSFAPMTEEGSLVRADDLGASAASRRVTLQSRAEVGTPCAYRTSSSVARASTLPFRAY